MEVCYVEFYEGDCKGKCIVLKNDDQIDEDDGMWTVKVLLETT